MTSNFLVWDNIEKLPLPEEVKNITKNVKWSDYVWQVFGLPYSGAKYNVPDGKTLYIEELPSGETKVEKQDFLTGMFEMGGYFVDNSGLEDATNYYVVFLFTIVKGEIIEIKQSFLNSQPYKEYRAALDQSQKEINRRIKISKSWWFKFGYAPYFYIIRGIAYLLMLVLFLLQNGVKILSEWLTPLK